MWRSVRQQAHEGEDMANVFISHRKDDAAQAEKLADEIRAAGHQVWFDEWEIDVGDSIVEKVSVGLESASYLVLCFSSAGLSPWVNREWMATLARQLSGHNTKILPIFLTGHQVPAILADIKHADLMKDWSKGTAELLRAIR
jgi:TIR domain